MVWFVLHTVFVCFMFFPWGDEHERTNERTRLGPKYQEAAEL